jgi:hypothetical protein
VERSCECGNEHSGSYKTLGNYRVATQLVGPPVVLSYIELIS